MPPNGEQFEKALNTPRTHTPMKRPSGLLTLYDGHREASKGEQAERSEWARWITRRDASTITAL